MGNYSRDHSNVFAMKHISWLNNLAKTKGKLFFEEECHSISELIAILLSSDESIPDHPNEIQGQLFRQYYRLLVNGIEEGEIIEVKGVKRSSTPIASFLADIPGYIEMLPHLPHEKYYHLFEPLPDFLQVIAFLDRIHAYLPGWEIPKLTPNSYSKDYGFITDYFCEIMHELRRIDPLASVRSRFELVDIARTAQGISGRDQRAIMKTSSGLLKLLYPDGQVTDEELTEVLQLSCELRQRVREQLHMMAPGEYDKLLLGVRMTSTGENVSPVLPDANRIQRVTLSEKPSVGEVIGLAVDGDFGCILHFEMQATKGNGRIVPLGSIQRVMRESIETAAQFIRAKHNDFGISAEWRQNFDVAVLATFMGVPKEGPSSGVAIVAGIVSALTSKPVRNDIAMTGEITIMGKVLPVGGIQQKVRAAYDSGIKEVLLPRDNLHEAHGLPQYILDTVTLTPVDTINDVLTSALVDVECS
ncbi:S16 family serine protease [Geomobilimonas luticola]|uniref:endopeptidase La n=1 Tax=Geomobilimonas luticola TaxID=1114878 RepID=A0ABS5SAD9_9BACT|nr:S16 family serine protease [Geomobilimonas luticola]MBT0652339.1 hypothetical protein [Geomobilimonas luticola]